jgi:restriction system protein
MGRNRSVTRRSARSRRFWQLGAGLGCIAATAVTVKTHNPWAGVIVGVAVFGGWAGLPVWAKARQVTKYLRSGLRDIDAMTGIDFENYVATRLRAAGYRVALTNVTGDFGVDLIASKDGQRIAIQCKRHARRIGAAAIQQVVAGALMHRCTSTMVVSNQEFTPAAIQLARVHSCELVGRTRLPKWARNGR